MIYHDALQAVNPAAAESFEKFLEVKAGEKLGAPFSARPPARLSFFSPRRDWRGRRLLDRGGDAPRSSLSWVPARLRSLLDRTSSSPLPHFAFAVDSGGVGQEEGAALLAD